MALEEKTSAHLGVPYIYLPDQRKFLCSNGVLFTLEEYKNGIDINAEYERREKEDKLYDYAYAKSTGLLRKKRGTANENIHKESSETKLTKADSSEEQKKSNEVVSERMEVSNISDTRTVTLICLLLLFTSLIS